MIAADLFPRGQQTLQALLGPEDTLAALDIRDQGALADLARVHQPAAWVHLAARVGEPLCDQDPALAVAVNRDSALSAARIARACGCRTFAFASTCSVYGIARDHAMTETDRPEPISVYGTSKLEAERLVLEQAGGGMTTVVFRLSTLFGLSQRMRFDLTVNQFAAEAHYENLLRVYSGSSKRPYLDVDDAARAFTWCVLGGGLDSGVYNVGHGSLNCSKDQIVALVRLHWPRVQVDNLGEGKDRRDYVVNFDKLAGNGFQPTRDVRAGLGEICSFLAGAGQPINFRSKLYEAT